MTIMQAIFRNESQKRLRAFWRILIVVMGLMAVFRVTNQLGVNISTTLTGDLLQLAVKVLKLFLVVTLLVMVARFIDKRPFSAKIAIANNSSLQAFRTAAEESTKKRIARERKQSRSKKQNEENG